MPAEKASPLVSKIKIFDYTDSAQEPVSLFNKQGEGSGGAKGDPKKSKVKLFGEVKREMSNVKSETKDQNQKKETQTGMSVPLETKSEDGPTQGESKDGMSVINKPYKTGQFGKIDVSYDEPMLGVKETVNQEVEKKKQGPNLTKDIIRYAPIGKHMLETPQDNTRVNLTDNKGNVNVNTNDGTDNVIPVQTQIPGKPLEEHVGDAVTTFGNAFSSWVNDQYQNVVNPNPQGIPLNPLFDVPFSEQLTKFIPGYENPRYKSTKDLPSDIKNFKLKTDYQYGDTPPEAPTEFIGHLTGSLVPLMLASMMGLPPTVSMPLIQEAGVQQRLKNGEITEGDANWERGAATLMGGLFDMPITGTLFKQIKDLPIKESTKMGITKAGDVIFKTIGTATVDIMSKIGQGVTEGKKWDDMSFDLNEIAVNAGTIFVMELMGGHQKIKKMSEKFGDDRLLDFAKKFARGEKLDPEIQADIEAVHNKPITDVRRLLIGPREHKFEVSPEGKVTEIKRNEPQDMLLSTLEREYGMKPSEIDLARMNSRRTPNVEQEGIAPGNLITDKNRMLPPKREANYKIDPIGNVVPVEYKQPEPMLTGKPKETGMSQKEVEKSQRRISDKPNVDESITAVKDPVLALRLKNLNAEFEAAKQKKESYPIWVEKNRDMYLSSEPEVRTRFKQLADKVQDWNRTKSVVEKVPAEVKEAPTQSVQSKEKLEVMSKSAEKIDIKTERVESIDMKKTEAQTGMSVPLETEAGELTAGDKVKSKNYRNPEEVLTVVDTRKDNMLKVRDQKGNESLVSKTSVETVPGSKLQEPRQKLEAKAKEVRKSRGKRRGEQEAEMLKLYDDYKQQYKDETGQEFTADKKSETGKVLEYIEAKKKIAGNKGKFGLQSSLLPGGFNPENLPEYVKIGKYHYENLKRTVKDKAITYGDWAIEMVKEFSDYIRPHLRDIWVEMKKRETTEVKREKDETATSLRSSQKEEKIRPERINQQGDFGFGDKGKIKSDETQTGMSVPLESKAGEPVKGKGWRADELVDEYRALKTRRGQFEKGSEKYETITKNMETMKKKIETLQDVSRRNKSMDTETRTRGKKDLFGEITKRLPDYEARANEQGYRGEDAYEQVKKLVKRDLQTDEAFQVMSPGQKGALIKLLDEKFRILNKSRLQIGGEMDEPYTERRLRKWIKRGILQSLPLIEKWGEGGKEFAQRMRKYHERERELMGEPSVTAIEAGDLNAAEYKNFTAIRKAMMMEDGLIPDAINEKVSNFNKRVNESYENMAELIKKRGFETINPATGEVYQFTPKKDYDPRVLDVTLDKLGVARDKQGEPIYNKLRERQLEYMVESGQAPTKSEAADMLDQFRSQEKVKIGKMGNVEYSRIKDIEFAPEMYIQDPMRRYINYMTKVSRRIAHEEQFGMEGNIATRLLDRIKGDNHDEAFARDLYRYETGNLTDKERGAMEDVNFVKGFNAVTKFSPFTTLRNSLQGILGSSIRGNFKSAVEGFARSFTKEAKKNALQSGSLADSIESVVMRDFGGDSNFVGNYLRWIGFTATDRFNRVVGSTAGEVFYKDMLSRLKNDSILKKRALREFSKMGLDADAVVKRGKFTESELNKIRRTFAGDTQFNIRPSDLPLWWSSPLGKLVTQWKPFSYKMTQMIRDNVIAEIKQGNPMPLITLLSAYAVGGEGVNTIIDLVRGMLNFNPRKEDKDKGVFSRTAYQKIKEGDVEGLVYRLIDDYAGLGAMGFMADIFRSMGYGKAGDTLSGVTSAVLGPTVSTVLSGTAEVTGPIMQKLFSSEGEWDEAGLRSLKGLYRTVLTNVPFGSIPRTFGFTKLIEKQIFPPKTSETQKLYDELEEKGVDVEKLKMIDDKKKEVEDLYKKAKESKDKKDIDAYVKADEELDKMQVESEEYQKYSDLKWERSQENSKNELLGTGKYKIWNELKSKGVDTGKLKEIETKEREVSNLKKKADVTKSPDDVKAWKTAKYELEKVKAKSREFYEFRKLEKKLEYEKKKEKQGLFK